MHSAAPFTTPSPIDVPSFGTMLPADGGVDIVVWLAFAVTYGLSVWLLIRRELRESSAAEARNRGRVLPLEPRRLPSQKPDQDQGQSASPSLH